jgi:fumarylacetoacetase
MKAQAHIRSAYFYCPTLPHSRARSRNHGRLSQDPNYGSYDIDLTVAIQPEGKSTPATVCTSNFRNLYWNAKQMVVHHTVTGCNLNPGDLMGSGTISGTEQDSFGSCVELSWGGKNPFALNFTAEEGAADAEAEVVERRFLVDGDNVIMSGRCSSNGLSLGFGTAEGIVLPAKPQV